MAQPSDKTAVEQHSTAARSPTLNPTHTSEPTATHDPPQADAVEKQSVKELLLSLLAGAIGVQSSANREKDFQKGRALTYIIAGSIGTILFIVGLVSLVQFILKNAS